MPKYARLSLTLWRFCSNLKNWSPNKKRLLLVLFFFLKGYEITHPPNTPEMLCSTRDDFGSLTVLGRGGYGLVQTVS